ncbi:MAG: RNA 2',3'-cyclic phosphodiesterase [Ignavibacteriales bacterium]
MSAADRGIRCFAAVPLEPRLAAAVVSGTSALRASAAAVKWVEIENLHFTLKFLGEIPEPRVEAARRGVGRAVSGAAPFTLSLRGAGCFPSSGPPRVVWVGLSHGIDALAGLAARVEKELAREGFPGERRAFTPHLTLGRVRNPAGSGSLKAGVERLRETDFGAMEVDQVSLMMSRLTPEGPVYSPIEEWNLQG